MYTKRIRKSTRHVASQTLGFSSTLLVRFFMCVRMHHMATCTALETQKCFEEYWKYQVFPCTAFKAFFFRTEPLQQNLAFFAPSNPSRSAASFARCNKFPNTRSPMPCQPHLYNGVGRLTDNKTIILSNPEHRTVHCLHG